MRLFDTNLSTKTAGKKAGRYFFGKVVDTSFDVNKPDELGSVQYRFISDNPGIKRGVAFPLLPNLKNIPLIDELILCVIAPSELQEETDKFEKVYYLSSINIWNHPQHSGYTREKDSITLHKHFAEQADINPMYPFPGDVILEGRKGQSLRFSETQLTTPWTGSVQGSPIVILSNGQTPSSEGYSFITENIRSDYSSIYLTSNQLVPSIDKLTSITSYDTAPIDPTEYQGSQAIITGDRVYIYAKTEKVLINSNDSVGISGREVNLDTTSKFTVESPKIYLTSTSKTETERAVLGDSLVSELSTLYRDLQELVSELGVLASTVGYAPLMQVSSELLTKLEIRETKLRGKLLTNRIFLSK